MNTAFISAGSPAPCGVFGRFGLALGAGAFGSVVTFFPSGFGFGLGLGFGFGLVVVVVGLGLGLVVGVVAARPAEGAEGRVTVVSLVAVALGASVEQAASSDADATRKRERQTVVGRRLAFTGSSDPEPRPDATFARMRGTARNAASVPDAMDPSTRAPTLAEPLVRELDRRVGDEQATMRLPSLVAGLVRDGSLVWWGSAGSTGVPGGSPADPTVQYRIGSISKTFAAVLVLRLRDEGLLELPDPIGAHLPELGELPVTVAQLLSHTSGLRAETPAPWWERVHGGSFNELCATALRPQDLLWRPGRHFHYSNVGYAVLGELVSRLRELPYLHVVDQELLVPLSMTRTTARPAPPFVAGLAVHPLAPLVLDEPEHDAGAMAPAGQLWSTIEDLALWSQVLLGDRPEVLRADTAQEMAEPIGLEDVPGQPWSSSYGLGLQLRNVGGRRLLGHGGAMPGHCAMLLADASSRDVAIGFTNSTYKAARPAFYDDLLATLAAGSPRPVQPFCVTQVPEGLLELLGTWYWGPVEYRISASEPSRLELRAVAGGRSCDFLAAHGSVDHFIGEWGYFRGEPLSVCRRPDGSVSHLDVASYVLTRAPYEPAAVVPGGVQAPGWHAGPT